MHEYPYLPVIWAWLCVTRQAKIVSTIGPACSSAEQIRPLVGFDIARLNMSHGDRRPRSLPRIGPPPRPPDAASASRGPQTPDPHRPLPRAWHSPGDEFTITTEDVLNRREVSTTYKGLP